MIRFLKNIGTFFIIFYGSFLALIITSNYIIDRNANFNATKIVEIDPNASCGV